MKTKASPRNILTHWLSDLHLDRASPEAIAELLCQVRKSKADCFVLTGDISTSTHLQEHLTMLASACSPRSLYFVCGNHDYYGSTIAEVESMIVKICASLPNLNHLDGRSIFSLGHDVCLIGHRGWADSRAGIGRYSHVNSPDRHAIRDFQKMGRIEYLNCMRALGAESAKHILLALTWYLRTLDPTRPGSKPIPWNPLRAISGSLRIIKRDFIKQMKRDATCMHEMVILQGATAIHPAMIPCREWPTSTMKRLISRAIVIAHMNHKISASNAAIGLDVLVHGFPVSHVAKRLGIHRSAVSQQLSRVRCHLPSILESLEISLDEAS